MNGFYFIIIILKGFISTACKEKRLLKSVIHGPRAFLKLIYFQKIENKKNFRTFLSNETVQRSDLVLTYSPLISIITPVFYPSPNALETLLLSVHAQTYTNWELCIVDASLDNDEIQLVLAQWKHEKRIKIKKIQKNKGISLNSNEAIRMAEGEFIAILDHDDSLAPNALMEVVSVLNEKLDLDLIYSDRDHIPAVGQKRLNPFFKPDWSPDLLLSANYLAHFCVVRKSVVDSVGGFDPDKDGAQDWDLFFKITEKTDKIHHIPKILYHWRMAPLSYAGSGMKVKPYAKSAQQRAISDHLKRKGLMADVISVDIESWRVVWALPEVKPLISIIIPTKDHPRLLKACIDSIIKKTSYRPYEIQIIDTGSVENETKCLFKNFKKVPGISVSYYKEPFNYSSVNNYVVKQAKGDLILFLNDDTEVLSHDWLEELAGWALNDEIGVVGCKLINPNSLIQHAGVVIGMTGFAGHPFAGTIEKSMWPNGSPEWYRNYLAVTGACLMIRRNIFDKIGGFDESFLLNGSDVELCLRVWRLGYRVVYTPYARLIHHEGKTRGKFIPPGDFEKSYCQYKQYLKTGDPYFSQNMSLWSTIPKIKHNTERPVLEYVVEFIGHVPECS